MKRLRFLLTFFLTISIILAFVSACNSDHHSSNSSKASLTMATSADYAPYEFVDSNSKEVKGFDIDIAKHITNKLGYGLRISNLDFNGLIPALQSKQADFVMAGMVPTEERKKVVDFSQLYYEARNTILAKKGSGLTTFEQLKDKTVGVQLGSMQEQRAKEIVGVNVKPLKQIAEIIQALKAGQIEAAIIEDTVAKTYAVNADLEATTIPNIPGKSGLAIAFPQGSALVKQFDQVISEMKTRGEIEAFVLKWFGDQAPSK
jgi:arginine/lysine/histidine transporter system substrate-binding protein